MCESGQLCKIFATAIALEKETKQSGKSDFDIQSLVTEVSRYLGYQIDRRKTTVMEFAGDVDSWKRSVEIQNKQMAALERKKYR